MEKEENLLELHGKIVGRVNKMIERLLLSYGIARQRHRPDDRGGERGDAPPVLRARRQDPRRLSVPPGAERAADGSRGRARAAARAGHAGRRPAADLGLHRRRHRRGRDRARPARADRHRHRRRRGHERRGGAHASRQALRLLRAGRAGVRGRADGVRHAGAPRRDHQVRHRRGAAAAARRHGGGEAAVRHRGDRNRRHGGGARPGRRAGRVRAHARHRAVARMAEAARAPRRRDARVHRRARPGGPAAATSTRAMCASCSSPRPPPPRRFTT